MPDDTARSTAWHQRIVAARWIAGWPSDTFITRMLKRARFSTAQSIASITSLDLPAPSASSTFRLMMCAPGATPRTRSAAGSSRQ